MNKITITVSGTTGVGKSTIALAIGKMLSFYHGFDIKYAFDTQLEESDDLESRIDDLVEKTEITINEVNEVKESVNGLSKV
jgi:adenylate kinase family enzyme